MMTKALDDLSVAELRHELKVKQLNPKVKKEELRERLESWIMDNGFDVDDYEFVDHFQEQLQNNKKKTWHKLSPVIYYNMFEIYVGIHHKI